MQSHSKDESKGGAELGEAAPLVSNTEGGSGRKAVMHGKTWHGGQAYRRFSSEKQLRFDASALTRLTDREDPGSHHPLIRRQLSSPMAGIPDSPPDSADGSGPSTCHRPPPVESTVHGAEPALPDHHFWRIRSNSLVRSTLQRQRSDLVLVLPRSERVIEIGEESKREGGGAASMLGGLGASLARSLSMSLSGLSQKGRMDERARHPVMMDEAICRICLDQLTEGESWRLECHCKGDMALAHQECALKWFNMRGSRLCEVCGSEVENLPVILERRDGTADGAAAAATPARDPPENQALLPRRYRNVPMVLIAAAVAYFCFFEQMMVSQAGKSAVSVSIPAAFVLAVTTTCVAVRTDISKIWVLALVQYIIVVVVAQIAYSAAHVGGAGACFIGGFVGTVGTIVVIAVTRDLHRYHSRRNHPPVPHGMGIGVVEGEEMVESGGQQGPQEAASDAPIAASNALPSDAQRATNVP